jgi:signal transduction histidine kinase
MENTSPPRQLRVLLIEDSPSDAALLQERIILSSDRSISVSIVQSLREAGESLANNHTDAVLLDLTLPDSMGLDTVRWARRVCSNLPVVVLTGVNDEQTGVEAVRMGIQDYLVKGQVDSLTIVRAIRYSIERKRFEEALAGERANLQAIFDAVNVGMFLIDEKGHLKRVNDAIVRWVGRTETDTSTLQAGDFLGCIHALEGNAGCGHTSHCTRCPIRGAFESAIKTGLAMHDVESEATISTGGLQVTMWFDISADPIVIDGKRHVVLAMNDITGRKRMEEELRRSHDELEARVEERTRQLRELASELTLTEQRERKRLALSLHDNLQQLLVAAKFRLAILRQNKDESIRQAANDVDDLISQSIRASRMVTEELSPYVLHEGGLVQAMKWLAKWMIERYSFDVNLTIKNDMPAIEEDVAVLLYQSVRELLFNAVKHAKVETASLELAMDEDRIRIVVSDEGAGFDSSRLSISGGHGGGFGLLSVQERLRLMGGSMTVETAPGKGTRITLESPPLVPGGHMKQPVHGDMVE